MLMLMLTGTISRHLLSISPSLEKANQAMLIELDKEAEAGREEAEAMSEIMSEESDSPGLKDYESSLRAYGVSNKSTLRLGHDRATAVGIRNGTFNS